MDHKPAIIFAAILALAVLFNNVPSLLVYLLQGIGITCCATAAVYIYLSEDFNKINNELTKGIEKDLLTKEVKIKELETKLKSSEDEKAHELQLQKLKEDRELKLKEMELKMQERNSVREHELKKKQTMSDIEHKRNIAKVERERFQWENQAKTKELTLKEKEISENVRLKEKELDMNSKLKGKELSEESRLKEKKIDEDSRLEEKKESEANDLKKVGYTMQKDLYCKALAEQSALKRLALDKVSYEEVEKTESGGGRVFAKYDKKTRSKKCDLKEAEGLVGAIASDTLQFALKEK